jgi:cholesterol transport system auxiliary component
MRGDARRIAWCAALALAACAGVTEDTARYDLGPAGPGKGPGAVEVQVGAPAWLDGTGIAYRLAYDDASRVRSYAHSRWAAPPAQLLAARLRQLLAGPGPDAPARSLRVELEEFSQVFDSQQQSHVLVQVRATLLAGGQGTREFVAQHPAGADAAGAVHGMQAAVAQLASDIQGWLDGAARASP